MHTLFWMTWCSMAVFSATEALPGAEAYLNGVEAQRHGRYDEAVLAYENSAARDESLAGYARVKAAQCLVLAGNSPSGIDRLEKIIDGPSGPWVRMARIQLAAAHGLDNNPNAAAHAYTAALAFEPKPWWVQSYAVKAARNALQTTEYRAEALTFFHDVATRIRYRYPRLEAARELAKANDPAEAPVAMLAMLRSAETEEAMTLFKTSSPVEATLWTALATELTPKPEVKTTGKTGNPSKTTKTAPKSKVHPKLPVHAKTPSQTTVSASKQRDEALAHVKTQVTTQHDAPWTRIGLAYLVRATTNAGQTEAAQTLCDLFLDQYPDAEEAPDVLYWLAARFEKDNKTESAIRSYLRIATLFPKHYRADDALFSAAQLYRDQGEKTAALTTLRTLTENQPDSLLAPNAWYWLGCAAERAGKTGEARKDYREAAVRGVSIAGVKPGSVSTAPLGSVGDYYAHRAWARLAALHDPEATGHDNVDVGGPAGFLKAGLSAIPDAESLPAEVRKDIRVRRLFFFGTNGLEEGEWEAVEMADTLRQDPMARAYYQMLSESGFAATAMDYAAAINWDCSEGKPGINRLRVLFPRAYWTEMVNAAKEVQLDPYLLLAAARQESTFRPALTSSAGACGVMQIMPNTAKLIAKNEPDIGEEGIDHLDVPHKSIRLGARYLKKMLDRNNGNVAYALAAYNAGPGNCAKWQAAFGSASLEDFIEQIPFDETRGYVKAVLGNYAAYHSLYPPES